MANLYLLNVRGAILWSRSLPIPRRSSFLLVLLATASVIRFLDFAILMEHQMGSSCFERKRKRQGEIPPELGNSPCAKGDLADEKKNGP